MRNEDPERRERRSCFAVLRVPLCPPWLSFFRGHDKCRAGLQHRRLVNRAPFGEPRKVQQRSVNQVCAPLQNQVAQNLSRRRRMHHAVPAESVGEEKSRHLRRLAQHRMMIRRHLIQPRPRLLRINFEILEHRHAIRRARKNFLKERRLEICLIPQRLLRIVPRQQKSRAPPAESESHSTCRRSSAPYAETDRRVRSAPASAAGAQPAE